MLIAVYNPTSRSLTEKAEIFQFPATTRHSVYHSRWEIAQDTAHQGATKSRRSTITDSQTLDTAAPALNAALSNCQQPLTDPASLYELLDNFARKLSDTLRLAAEQSAKRSSGKGSGYS